jgi:hypothetical protein
MQIITAIGTPNTVPPLAFQSLSTIDKAGFRKDTHRDMQKTIVENM